MIIVEGPDGAGKTTLVNELCDGYGLKIGQRAVADRKLLYTVTRQDTYSALAQEVLSHDLPVVWDRLYYSEHIYAPIVGRECEFNHQDQRFIEQLLEFLDVPVILCHPPLDVVKMNAAKDEQMDGVNENLEAIYWRYLNLRPLRRVAMLYDYTTPDGDGEYFSHADLFMHINDYMERRRARLW